MITPNQASQAYSTARSAIAPLGNAPKPSTSETSFAGMLQGVSDMIGQVDTAAAGAMTGQIETHQLVQSLAETEVALETVVAIRDKVVEAYQEILRMPV